VNIVSSTPKIIFVLFIRTLFCLSYIIHAPTLKNDPRLAYLPKSGRIFYCLCFRKYIKFMMYKFRAPLRQGDYISNGRCLILAANIYQYRNTYQWKRTEHKSPKKRREKITPELWDFSTGTASRHRFDVQNLEVSPGFLENLWIPV